MKLFPKEEVNIGRQFEFDLAKAICILGMVFVHSFEVFSTGSTTEGSSIYFVFVVVLDAIFGAGTFMVSMGLGIAYSKNSTPKALMMRGIRLFFSAFALNFFRTGLPLCLQYFTGENVTEKVISATLSNDILMFAGVSLFIFGLLKKLKVSDLVILIIALVLSIVGSFVRFIDFGPFWITQIVGILIGAIDDVFPQYTMSAFPFINWFIFVVFGYLLGKFLRRCTNVEKYYAISLPISAVVLIAYLAISIPNRFGMMNEDLIYFYQMTTFDALIIISGAVFATGVYHYLSKLFSDKVKKIITRLSSNINSVYCLQWIMIGWFAIVVYLVKGSLGFNTLGVIVTAIVIYIISNVVAEIYKRTKEKRKLKK